MEIENNSDGKNRQNIKYLIRKLNLSSRVEIIRKSSQVWKEILMCDFYINSSKWEGMPNAVDESSYEKKFFK